MGDVIDMLSRRRLELKGVDPPSSVIDYVEEYLLSLQPVLNDLVEVEDPEELRDSVRAFKQAVRELPLPNVKE